MNPRSTLIIKPNEREKKYIQVLKWKLCSVRWGGRGRRSSFSSSSLHNLWSISKWKPRMPYASAHSLLNEHMFFKKPCPPLSPQPRLSKRDLKKKLPVCPLKLKPQALPFLPISMLRNLIALQVLLKDSIDVCSLRLSSPSNFSDTQALSDSGPQHRASFLWLPVRVSLQVLRPFTFWFQQPLWPLDRL